MREPLHVIVEAELPADVCELHVHQACEILQELLKPVVSTIERSQRSSALHCPCVRLVDLSATVWAHWLCPAVKTVVLYCCSGPGFVLPFMHRLCMTHGGVRRRLLLLCGAPGCRSSLQHQGIHCAVWSCDFVMSLCVCWRRCDMGAGGEPGHCEEAAAAGAGDPQRDAARGEPLPLHARTVAAAQQQLPRRLPLPLCIHRLHRHERRQHEAPQDETVAGTATVTPTIRYTYCTVLYVQGSMKRPRARR